MGGSVITEVISLSQWLWSDGSRKDQTLGRGETAAQEAAWGKARGKVQVTTFRSVEGTVSKELSG